MDRKRIAIVGAAAAAIAIGIGGVAIGSSDDDSTERPITGPALEKASNAALAETGGGTVTDTEVDDEESKYEVEVTLDDGTQVDVQLDENFEVVGTESESGEDD